MELKCLWAMHCSLPMDFKGLTSLTFCIAIFYCGLVVLQTEIYDTTNSHTLCQLRHSLVVLQTETYDH
jgi:hypothetical protein